MTQAAQEVCYDKKSGRALTTLLGTDHITILFTGDFWDKLDSYKRKSVLDKLSSYNGINFTITDVVKKTRSYYFKSVELSKIRKELIYNELKDISNVFDTRHDTDEDCFHCQYSEGNPEKIENGSIFVFKAASGLGYPRYNFIS